MKTRDANLNHPRNAATLFAIILVTGLATAVIMYSSDRFSLLYYGDAVSHLIAGRKLFDWSENPGWPQLGTVWLPLPHFLLMFPSMLDSLFFSGFAGLAVSLPSLALTSIYIYKIIVRVLSVNLEVNHWIIPYSAFAGALLYALNPNILYLGITAMTEATFTLFFAGSAYYLLKWLELYPTGSLSKQAKYVIFSSLFASAATLCRYEGWVLPLFIISAVVLATVSHRCALKKRPAIDRLAKPANKPSGDSLNRNKALLAITLLASVVSASGIAFWLIYNKITYGNALEFESLQYYSAASQAMSRPIRETLFLQPLNDFNVYGTTMFMVYGPVILASAGAGYYLYLRLGKSINKSDKPRIRKTSLFILYLVLPPAFTVASLLVGIGEMTLWFNSRFVILAAPLLLVLVAVYLARQPKKIMQSKVLLLGVIASLFIFQSGLPAFGAVVTLADATAGYTTGQTPYATSVGEKLGQIYDGNGLIMIITGSAQEHRVMISSGIPLHKFDDITESSSWKKSFYEPWKTSDRFIVLGKQPDSDTVSVVKYWNEHRELLTQYYHQLFENKYYEILARN